MSHRTGFLLGVLVALAIPTSALAATPSSGSVSPTAQTATATGSVADPLGAYDLTAFFNGGTTVHGQNTCQAPACDVYKLDVAPGGNQLRIVVDAPHADNVSMDITGPFDDHYMMNTADYFTQRTLIVGADAGKWTIQVYGTGAADQLDTSPTFDFNLPGDPDFVPPNDGSDASG
jgi:hypothetical protein